MKRREEKEMDFIEKIKVDSKSIDNIIHRKNFLEELDGNVEALNRLSDDRLKVLIKYYESLIEDYKKRLKKLEEDSD